MIPGGVMAMVIASALTAAAMRAAFQIPWFFALVLAVSVVLAVVLSWDVYILRGL
jgi:hypothetical protein